MLPDRVKPELERHLERLRLLHKEDRANQLAGVWMPEGLARKYPRAGEQWGWQWVFPARKPALDPVGRIVRRRHVTDSTFQSDIRRAANLARLDKRVTRMFCDTVLRPTCWKAEPISARCRSCSATSTSASRRFICTA
jgi:hypothetical protein